MEPNDDNKNCSLKNNFRMETIDWVIDWPLNGTSAQKAISAIYSL